MSGRGGKRIVLICSAVLTSTLVLLSTASASPEPYLLCEDSNWLVKDHGANDGLTRLKAKDLDNDGTVEIVVVRLRRPWVRSPMPTWGFTALRTMPGCSK